MNMFTKFGSDFSVGFKEGYQNPHRMPLYIAALKMHWYASIIVASNESKRSFENAQVPTWALGIMSRACAVHDRRIEWATKKFDGIEVDGWMDFDLEAHKAQLRKRIRIAERRYPYVDFQITLK